MSAEPFAIRSFAAWGDMDANAHMANVAYLDKCVDSRMSFFMQHGFPPAEFAKRRLGPVVRRDQLDYHREIGLMEEMTIRLWLGGMSEDGTRFRIVNEFVRADGQVAARVTSDGGWLDLAARKLIVPPPDLMSAMNAMPRHADFEVLKSSLKA